MEEQLSPMLSTRLKGTEQFVNKQVWYISILDREASIAFFRQPWTKSYTSVSMFDVDVNWMGCRASSNVCLKLVVCTMAKNTQPWNRGMVGLEWSVTHFLHQWTKHQTSSVVNVYIQCNQRYGYGELFTNCRCLLFFHAFPMWWHFTKRKFIFSYFF